MVQRLTYRLEERESIVIENRGNEWKYAGEKDLNKTKNGAGSRVPILQHSGMENVQKKVTEVRRGVHQQFSGHPGKLVDQG